MIAFSGFNMTRVFKQEFEGKNLRRSLIYDFNIALSCSRAKCQSNDSLAYIDGNGRNVEFLESHDESSIAGPDDGDQLNRLGEGEGEGEVVEALSLDELREVLQKAIKELEVASLNSTMFEDKAQKISEAAIALQDEAAIAWNDVNSVLNTIQEIVNEECIAKEAVQKATMALSLAEARLQVAKESLEAAKIVSISPESSRESDSEDESRMEGFSSLRKEEEAFLVAQEDIRHCKATLLSCEAELKRLQCRKEELQKEVDKLNEKAEKTQMDALKAEEEVANIMLLAEQAVAFELEATQHVNDAEIAIQKVEKSLSNSQVETPETTQGPVFSDETLVEEEKASQGISGDVSVERERDMPTEGVSFLSESLSDSQPFEELKQYDDLSDQENGKLSLESPKEPEAETEKSKTGVQTKKQETQKDLTRDSSMLNAPKILLKKSSRFFSASFFSFTVDGTDLMESARRQFPKLVVGMLLLGAGVTFYSNRAERSSLVLHQPDVITTSIEEVSSNAKPLVRQIRKLPKRIKKLIAMLPHQEA
uniref:K(+) efflux antiporter 2, chloroplastic n=1 Tax=Vitis vinifera TaxID=29760 RepID=F6I6I6_VITVI